MLRIYVKVPPAPVEIPEPAPLGLELTYDDIINAIEVADIYSISNWNTFFNLPINGAIFTSVIVVGNTITLFGGGGISIKETAFYTSYLISVNDKSNCIAELGVDSFKDCLFLSVVRFNAVESISSGSFKNEIDLSELSIPSCTSIGETIGNDGVFTGTTGQTITLTIPAALMTCNAGAPDGDVQYLITNNTVTIVTV